MKLIYTILLISLTIHAGSWDYKQNKHGFILKSSTQKLYLGKDCDALSPIYGKGQWFWNNDGISVILKNKNFYFDSNSLYTDKRCKKSYYNNSSKVLIPANKCALIVASRRTKDEVRNYINNNIINTKYLNVYKAKNGWYAISIGFLKRTEYNSVIKKWKSIGKIPQDSFCSSDAKFTEEVYISLNNTKSIPAHSKTTKYKKDRTMICLAKTWGPDVCSTQFNKFAKKELNGEVTDIINSPICAVTISELVNESATEGDIQMAIITGGLDDLGKEGIESDNVFYNIAGAFSYLYSFSIKLNIYEDCMNQ